MEAETPELFVENGRWGYRTAERVVVAPLYDNGFDFTEGWPPFSSAARGTTSTRRAARA